MSNLSRRSLGVAAGVIAGLTATGCGSSKKGDKKGGTTGWLLAQGSQPTYEFSQKEWNKAHSNQKIDLQYFANDAYKDKIRVAIGANKAPTIFENWGGGVLEDYVKAGKVESLTATVGPIAKQKYLASVLNVATFNDQLYAIPANGSQPVLLFYNKDLFTKVGAQPPKTWEDLISLVSVFKKADVAALALGGASKWPDLMYLEYLVDRVGGPSVFNDIVAGKPSAWSNPAIIRACTMIQQLVDAGAFAKGFQSTTYDNGQATALMYTGKAAMHLMGTWDFSSVVNGQPNFIKEGKLGWTTFPTVSDGAGDPTNIVGNPANYFSITSAASATDKKNATDYFTNMLGSDPYVDDLLKHGEVPPIAGLESKLSSAANSDWLLFQYNAVKNSRNYQLSWDQALSSKAASDLLTNLDQLFLKKITPQQFADNMNQVGK